MIYHENRNSAMSRFWNQMQNHLDGVISVHSFATAFVDSWSSKEDLSVFLNDDSITFSVGHSSAPLLYHSFHFTSLVTCTSALVSFRALRSSRALFIRSLSRLSQTNVIQLPTAVLHPRGTENQRKTDEKSSFFFLERISLLHWQ